MSVQAISAAWLIYRLKGRYPLRMAGRDAMKNLSKFLGPTGEDACWFRCVVHHSRCISRCQG